MFEESLVESTAVLHSRNRAPVLIAFAIQATVVIALVTIPLVHPEIIPLHAPRLTLFTPPPAPKPPPPPRALPHVATTTDSVPSTPASAPQLPHVAFQTDALPVDQPALPVGVNLGATNPSTLPSLLGTGPAIPHASAAPEATPAPVAGPVHVSTGVMAGRLITPIQPLYPPIARLTHSEGTVVIEAIISKSGSIASAHVISGPAVLRAAALEAVRAARYHPFLLNDQPTEVQTTISIIFRFGS
jgi:protein TonB